MVGKRSQQGSVSIDAALPTNPLDQKLSDVAVRSPTDSDPPPADTSSNPLTHDKEPPFRFLLTWRFWCILVLGQILSWCIVSTNTFTEYLALDGANIPAFQSLFNYALLNVIYTGWTMYKYGSKKWAVLVWKDGWKYFVLGFADVQGNYFVVKGFSYTNLLSAELLDACSIITVVVLSFLFMKVRYHWSQLLGICVCLGGLGLLVASDAKTGKNYGASDAVKGDLFVILGACCYGISNVLEEFLVSKRPLYEVVGQIGFWGTIIMGVQCAIFERTSIQNTPWNGAIAGYLVGYTLTMFILYSLTPILFRLSSAMFYNLSLLTSDFWGLIIGIRLFGFYVYKLYPVAFTMTILGLTIYYTIVNNVAGEAMKPWLGGEAQVGGIVGVGTYKRKPRSVDEESIQSSAV